MKSPLIILTAAMFLAAFGQRVVAEPRDPTYTELPPYRQSHVMQIAFSPSGKLCASAGPAGVRVWHVEGRRTLMEADAHRVRDQAGPGELCQVSALAFALDEKVLFTAGMDGNICRWEIASGEKNAEIALPWVYSQSGSKRNYLTLARVPVTALAVSPDGKRLAAAYWGKIRLYDAESMKLIAEFGESPRSERVSLNSLLDRGKRSPAYDASSLRKWFYLPDDAAGELKVWDASAALAKLNLQFSADGGFLIASGNFETTVWDAHTRKTVRTVPGSSASLSRDGRRLAVVARNRVSLWDMETGESIATLPQTASHIAFTHDPDCLLLAHADQLCLWQISTQQEVWRFPGEYNGGHVVAIAVARDGTIVASWDNWTNDVVRVFGPTGEK